MSQSPTIMRSSLDSNRTSTITNVNNTAILSSNDDFSRLQDCDNLGSYVTVKVRILSASNLPLDLSQFVFCKYKFWGETKDTIVPPTMQPENVHHSSKNFAFKFDHSAEYSVKVTDDLLEHFAEDALSVEVFGNKNSGIEIFRQYQRSLAPIEGIIGRPEYHLKDHMFQKERDERNTCKDLSDRWRELYRKLELWVCIEELNEEGSYQKVEVTKSTNINAFETATGGVFQLRHGQTRRVRVCLRPNKISRGYRGSLPLVFDKVEKIYIGNIVKVPKPRGRFLDSYQEEGLNQLRESWCCAVNKRHEHLNDQLQKLTKTENKTVSEESREKTLMDQWMRLTEEREAVLVPAAGSGIPGAPATWNPVDGMERHCPVVFINTGGKEMSCASSSSINEVGKGPFPIVGDTSLLTGCSSENNFVGLPIIKRYGGLCGAVAQWDSSIHDNICLNTVTQENCNIFLTVKVVVRLNQPHCVDLVLRKRICINIYKKQGLSSFLKKQWNRYVVDDSLQTTWSGVTYQIVAGIPQASLDIEDRESLAELAASDLSETSETSFNQESYIEKYIRSVSAVEGLLQLDRIRQEVACQEMVTHARKECQFLVKSVNPESAMKEIQNSSSCVLACRSGEEISGASPSQITNIFNDIDVLDSQQEYITSTNVANREEVATGLSRAHSSIILDQEIRLKSPLSGSNPQLQSNLTIKTGNENRSSIVPKRPQPPKNLLATNQFSSMNLPTQWSNKSHPLVIGGNKNNQISMEQKNLSKNETKMSLTEDSVLLNTLVRNSDPDDFRGAIEKTAIKIPLEEYESSMTGSSKIPRITQNVTDGLGLQTSTISDNLTKETDISWNNDIIVGSRVSTLCNTGETVNATVKYFDKTHLGEGRWLGLELDEPKGSHDGTVDGNAYFSCASNRGLFVLPHNIFVLKSTGLIASMSP